MNELRIFTETELRDDLTRKTLVLLSALILSTLTLLEPALAEGTRTWEQSKFDDLTKGTPKGIALRSEGGLELAPAFKSLATTPSTYIWSIASDAAGNVYAAAGSPARVYRIAPDGQVTTIFEPQELQVQTLVVDKSGIVYAATAPDGKVYKLEPSREAVAKAGYKAAPFFDPGAKYIWDLVLDSSGALYVATGDHGEIFKVSAKGEHSLFFQSDEVHIRALALDPKGNLIAGSDGSGLVYRIAPNGEAFVLYSAAKKEITALAIDPAGNIYVAAAGEKRPGSTPQISITLGPPAQTAPVPGANISMAAVPTAPPQLFPAPGLGATGGSEIYRIAPDGAPSRLWTSRDDLVYALGFDQRGRLLAGTGNRGHIFAINGVNEDDYTDLIKASATQITAFAAAPGGAVYASGSNLGKIFVLGAGSEAEGSYESDVFDAHIFSLWGRATVRSVGNGNGNVELYARSGNVDNPDRNWSPWTRVDLTSTASAELKIPPARFVQWKTVLHASTPAPRVDQVLLNYLPKNVAPEVDEITVQPGYHYQPIPHVTGSDSASPGQPRFDPPAPAIRDRDSIGVRWQAHDDNDDQLVYTVYYRGDNESRWLLLKSNLTDRYYSFDSSLLPDGGYTVKVIASDTPSHSPGEALYAERVSARFEVDTTAPVIESLTAVLDSKTGEKKLIRIRFRASDSFSPIKRAEYSLDGGDWQFVEPVGQLSDAKTEDYDFRVPIPPAEAAPTMMAGHTANDHVVVVRAYDRFDNLATAKTVTRGK